MFSVRCIRLIRNCSSKSDLIKSSSAFMITDPKQRKIKNEVNAYSHEYEKARKFLARIMDQNPENFTYNDIKKSIEYLFPSDLIEPEARPVILHPDDLKKKLKTYEFDDLGRPSSSFFYTNSEIFSELLYHGNYAIETCKSEEDKAYRNKNNLESKLVFDGQKMISKEKLEKYCKSEISEDDYKKFVKIIQVLENHPCNYCVKEFLNKFYEPNQIEYISDDLPQIQTDPKSNRLFVESYGQKKWTFVNVTIYKSGSGLIEINEQPFIKILPNITDREAVLTPLKLTNMINKVDIIASSSKSYTCSSLALSLRLAISRGLTCFLDKELSTQLRLAGLLTQDDRLRECKMPGQPKARKKPGWIKR